MVVTSLAQPPEFVTRSPGSAPVLATPALTTYPEPVSVAMRDPTSTRLGGFVMSATVTSEDQHQARATLMDGVPVSPMWLVLNVTRVLPITMVSTKEVDASHVIVTPTVWLISQL